jgi:hypothetical protein
MKIDGYGPDMILVSVELPKGIKETDSEMSRIIYELKNQSNFAGIPKVERDSLFFSLSKTYERYQYHLFRFGEIKSYIEFNRSRLPNEIFFDSSLKYLYFEIQSLFGAIRLFLDELMYLVARNHGFSHEDAVSGNWEAKNIFTLSQPNATKHFYEVKYVLSHLNWYEKLNKYRNAFYHHGWNHQFGHSDTKDISSLASSEKYNGLFVPDESSVKTKSKPFQWTWNNKTHIYKLVSEIEIGFEKFITGLIRDVWLIPSFDVTGTIPISDQPNIIISLPRPVVIFYDCDVVVPVFSSRKKAQDCNLISNTVGNHSEKIEIIKITENKLIGSEGYFTFSLNGIENRDFPEEIKTSKLRVALDPVFNEVGKVVSVSAIVDNLKLSEISDKSLEPVSVSFPGQQEIYVWRQIKHS